jgi:hypothetical protein
MNIRVKYLESKVIKAGDSFLEVKGDSDTYVQASLIHVDRNDDGSTYGYIVLLDGSIKRVLTSLLRVDDDEYLNFDVLGPTTPLKKPEPVEPESVEPEPKPEPEKPKEEKKEEEKYNKWWEQMNNSIWRIKG